MVLDDYCSIVQFESTPISVISHVSKSRILQHRVYCFTVCDPVLLDQNVQSRMAAGNESSTSFNGRQRQNRQPGEDKR